MAETEGTSTMRRPWSFLGPEEPGICSPPWPPSAFPLGLAGLPGDQLIRLSRLADEKRFRAIWVPEITFVAVLRRGGVPSRAPLALATAAWGDDAQLTATACPRYP